MVDRFVQTGSKLVFRKKNGSNRTVLSKFQIYNSLYFLQFLDTETGHEEFENHGPEALGIRIRAILALFLIKCEKKGKD